MQVAILWREFGLLPTVMMYAIVLIYVKDDRVQVFRLSMHFVSSKAFLFVLVLFLNQVIFLILAHLTDDVFRSTCH